MEVGSFEKGCSSCREQRGHRHRQGPGRGIEVDLQGEGNRERKLGKLLGPGGSDIKFQAQELSRDGELP